VIYLWDGSDWVEWKTGGLQELDLLKTTQSDWIISVNQSGASGTISKTDSSILFQTADSTSGQPTITFTYKDSIHVRSGQILSILSVFTANINNANHAYAYIEISDDNFATKTVINSKDASTTGNYTLNNDFSLNNFVGKDIKFRIRIIRNWSGQTAAVRATKLLIK